MIVRFRVLTALAVTAALGIAAPVKAQILTEGFDVITAGTPGAGWFAQNNSTTIGTTPLPFQGNSTVFPSHSGAPTSYVGMNFQHTTAANTISMWLLTPTIPLDNGTVISFFTRTITGPTFPDRLQLRLGTNGASTNVGALATDVGDFGTLLLDINPTYLATGAGSYPDIYTQFDATISGLGAPTTGRVAFRYFVENGGPAGANSDYIGVDTLTITAVPEPTSMALCGLVVTGVAAYRRRKAKA